MQILKNIKDSTTRDTVVQVNDTIALRLNNIVKFQHPDEEFVVHTISQPLSGIELVGIWVAAILGLVTIIYTLIQLKKLLKNDNELQSQINELIKLNQLFEKRLRMTVKPHLWTNGSGYNGTDYTIHIEINNRGAIAFYKDFVALDGEGSFTIQKWKKDIALEKGGRITLSGTTVGHPKDSYFKIKIFYYDSENYEYETIIEWDNGHVNFLETVEL